MLEPGGGEEFGRIRIWGVGGGFTSGADKFRLWRLEQENFWFGRTF